MADKKPSSFCFRLPWLLQPTLPRTRESPTQPPRTTTQTSAATTTAQRPPFRPPGKAPAPPPAALAAPPQTTATPPPSVSPKSTVPETPDPATPPQMPPFSQPRQTQSPPSSIRTPSPSPPPSVSPKSSVPQSTITKTIETVTSQPAKETQTTTETIQTIATADPATPPLSPPLLVSPKSSVPESPIAKTTEPVAAPANETQTTTETIQTIATADPTTPPLSPPPLVSPKSSVPKSPTAKTTKPVAAQPPNETQTTTETIQTIATADPTTLPLSPPPVSPKTSVPKSPIAKNTELVPAQPPKETQTTTETIQTIATADSATPPLSPPLSPATQAQSQPSGLQTPPQSVSFNSSPIAETTEPVAPQPTKQTQTTTETIETAGGPATQAQSPRLDSEPTTGKTPTKSTNEEKNPPDSNYVTHLALDEKSREITQTETLKSHSMDSKSQRPKLETSIKDKFLHRLAAKESTDEKPASVITIAGDNTGASMQLGLDNIKRGYNLTADYDASENQEPKAIVNSNIQGINNSIMLDSSVNERNPGVHLGFYRNQAKIEDSMVKNTESIEMQKVEANITPPHKLVYDPTMPSECEFEDDEAETSGKSYEIEVL